MADLDERDTASPVKIVSTNATGVEQGYWDLSSGAPRVDSRPPYKVEYHSEPFLNGASPNMNVNGAVTPVVFSIGPGAGEEWCAVRLGYQMDDGGQADTGKFGNINGGLTNGLLIEHVFPSAHTHTFKNLQFNEQVVMHFSEGSVVTGDVGIVKSTGFFQGHFDYNGPPFTLNGDDGDLIRVTIRDNLSSINLLRMALSWWEVVE